MRRSEASSRPGKCWPLPGVPAGPGGHAIALCHGRAAGEQALARRNTNHSPANSHARITEAAGGKAMSDGTAMNEYERNAVDVILDTLPGFCRLLSYSLARRGPY